MPYKLFDGTDCSHLTSVETGMTPDFYWYSTDTHILQISSGILHNNNNIPATIKNSNSRLSCIARHTCTVRNTFWEMPSLSLFSYITSLEKYTRVFYIPSCLEGYTSRAFLMWHCQLPLLRCLRWMKWVTCLHWRCSDSSKILALDD